MVNARRIHGQSNKIETKMITIIKSIEQGKTNMNKPNHGKQDSDENQQQSSLLARQDDHHKNSNLLNLDTK